MANNDNITYGSAFDDSANRGLGSQPDLPIVSFMYHLDCKQDAVVIGGVIMEF
jgi:hypothetical protein